MTWMLGLAVAAYEDMFYRKIPVDMDDRGIEMSSNQRGVVQ